MFVVRLLNTYQYSIFLVNHAEFFPVMIRGVAVIFIAAFGSLGSGLTQIVFINSSELASAPSY